MELDTLSYRILGAAYRVHLALGPGLLESAYEACLVLELHEAGFVVERQRSIPVMYRGLAVDAAFRADIVVENTILLELKSVDEIAPIHKAQILTYLRLTGLKLGLLINFNVPSLKRGIHRFVM
jgi:GxxExxY protein